MSWDWLSVAVFLLVAVFVLYIGGLVRGLYCELVGSHPRTVDRPELRLQTRCPNCGAPILRT